MYIHIPWGRYQDFLAEVRLSDLTDAQFEKLVGYLGTPLETLAEPQKRDWAFPNDVTFLHCFSIISTIGYGNIAPATDVGKIFTIIYVRPATRLMHSSLNIIWSFSFLFVTPFRSMIPLCRRFWASL